MGLQTLIIDDVRPIGVQIRRTKGWELPPNTVKVGGRSKFANPFKAGPDFTAEEAVMYYEEWIRRGLVPPSVGRQEELKLRIDRLVLLRYITDLRGKNLACYCALNAPCHRNPLLRLANPGVFDGKSHKAYY